MAKIDLNLLAYGAGEILTREELKGVLGGTGSGGGDGSGDGNCNWYWCVCVFEHKRSRILAGAGHFRCHLCRNPALHRIHVVAS